MRRRRLNSGYSGNTDQRKTLTGTIPVFKHYMERRLRSFLFGDSIVLSNLVLYLDAKNSNSYPGSGSVWNDLSGNGNNGTLVNEPTYSSTNGGELIFNGTNQFVNCGNAANLQITVGTIAAWIKADNTNSAFNGIVTKQFAWSLFVYNNELVSYDWGNSAIRSTNITVGDNTWRHVAMSFAETNGAPLNNAIIYVNGSPVLTTTVKSNSQNVAVAIGDGSIPTVSQNFGGSISQVTVYNRVLSESEITQNYNAVKGFYGL